MWNVTNPGGINLSEPLVYYIQISSPEHEYRYVGKSSSSGRLLSAYQRNVSRIFKRETKRPRVKRNGEVQSKGVTDFAQYAYRHGLPASALGAEFVAPSGSHFTLTGYRPRADRHNRNGRPSTPMSAERIPDGKRYRFSVVDVAEGLKRAS